MPVPTVRAMRAMAAVRTMPAVRAMATAPPARVGAVVMLVVVRVARHAPTVARIGTRAKPSLIQQVTP